MHWTSLHNLLCSVPGPAPSTGANIWWLATYGGRAGGMHHTGMLSCYKVIFLHLFVILFGGWVHAWWRGSMRGEGGMHGKEGYVWQRGACVVKGGAWQRGVCVAKGGVWWRGACMVKGRHAWWRWLHGKGGRAWWRGACVVCTPPSTRYGRSMRGQYASYWNAFSFQVIWLRRMFAL